MIPAAAASLGPAIDMALRINPVPGLSFAFTLYSLIVTTISDVQASRTQLRELAGGIGQLLTTLDAEFRAAKRNPETSARALADLKALLEDIHRFVEKEQRRRFLSALWNQETRSAAIAGFYRRIATTVQAFQISALLNVQSLLRADEKARAKDKRALHARLAALEKSQLELGRTLGMSFAFMDQTYGWRSKEGNGTEINQRNIMSMIVAIQRRLDAPAASLPPVYLPSSTPPSYPTLTTTYEPEGAFLRRTLDYLTAASNYDKKFSPEFEQWMISEFELEYEAQIGAGGGFSEVFKGTWNHHSVAIRVLQTSDGVSPDMSILRKEIKVWLTLRHPNILQFLGANTLDGKPFIVTPYMPENARQFLARRVDFDPIFILRDTALGLEYLHSRGVCHENLKGVNILVESSTRALLCDFGLARSRADMTARSAAIVDGAARPNWMAPELLAGLNLHSAPSDVYALGMTVYELYTHKTPLSTLGCGEYLSLAIRGGLRPLHPEAGECPGVQIDDAMWELACSCWEVDAQARPSAGQVFRRIAQVLDARTAAKARAVPTELDFPDDATFVDDLGPSSPDVHVPFPLEDFPRRSTPLVQPQHCSLARLRRLSVEDISSASNLFRYLILPSLRCLEYMYPGPDRFLPASPLSCFSVFNSALPLETFHLRASTLTTDVLVAGLRLASALKELRLSGEPPLLNNETSFPEYDTELVPLLTPSSSTPGDAILCPHLQHITLLHFSATSDATLLAFLLARTDSSLPLGSCLASARIRLDRPPDSDIDIVAALQHRSDAGFDLALEYGVSPWKVELETAIFGLHEFELAPG
ncbi:Kinase-like protein [Mycena sanguinolenta]|uniref:Kinase-like protein n=1 Tax=Mycena sanguinolenta TaxID=230812 RepID=A0A8H6Z5Z4_9AGAR|nr:Kinase-like protein [Mycena sanguinolenta]